MEKSRLGKFIDNFFIFFLILISLFLWTKKYIRKSLYAFIIAFIISFIVFKIILYIQNKKYRKLMLEKSDLNKINIYNYHLRTLTKKEQLEFFKKMFLDKRKYIVSGNNLIIEDQILFIIELNTEEINSSSIFNIYKNIKIKKNSIKEVALVCNKINSNALKISDSFSDLKFTIFTPLETYALMKNYNYFPIEIENKTKLKKSLKKRLINEVLIRKQAKNFIKCGFLLYIACLFVPFTNYYLISASVCLFLGAICFCFGKKEIKINSLSQKYLLN